jgi:tripartite-type tricarboxylate transporter receptor subunit TctC
MKRRFLLAMLAGSVVAASLPARSQDAYPNRPVKIIVGFPAGTTTDILARIYGDKLSERLGQRFIIENQPGGASNTASAAAARAEPDGYTLLLATNANSASVSLYKTLRYDFPGDFAPISLLASAPPILVVSPSLGVSTVKELIAYAKARPGEVMYGSAGVGTGPQLAAELFNMEAGVKLTHVPYKGTNEAVSDLLTGRLSVLFAPYPSVAGFVKEGRLKALATTTEKRSSVAPELPTIAEAAIPGFDVTLWFGLVAPKGTPAPVLKVLADAVDTAKQSEDVKRRLAASGGEPIFASLDDFAAFIRADIPKWKKAIEHAGMKIE